MSAAVAADLRAAKDLLVADGWIQGAGKTDCGRCLGRAIADAAELRGSGYLPARDAVFRLIPSSVDIADWNDAGGRVKEQVLALLDKAIAAEEARP